MNFEEYHKNFPVLESRGNANDFVEGFFDGATAQSVNLLNDAPEGKAETKTKND